MYEDQDIISESTLAEFEGIPNIKLFKIGIDPKLSLGALRNISVSKASGQYFCQWDDDDWYSMHRLEEMYHSIGTSKSVLLDQWFIYNEENGRSYLSNKRTWEGSILYKREKSDSGEYYSDCLLYTSDAADD